MKKIIVELLVVTFVITCVIPVRALEIINISTKANIKDVVGGKAISFVVTQSSVLPSISVQNNTDEKTINCNVAYKISGAINEEGIMFTGDELILNQEGSYDIEARFTDLVFFANKTYNYKHCSEHIVIEKLLTPEITYDGETVSITSGENADIYYSIDESASEQSILYDGEFAIESENETVTITAFAVKEGYVTSDISKIDVTIEKETDKEEAQCSICGESVLANDVLYDEEGAEICQVCYENDSQIEDEEEQKYINIKCTHCFEIFEISEKEYIEQEYIEQEYIVCPYCDEIVNEDDAENETECFLCGEFFDVNDMIYVEDGILCSYCINEYENEMNIVFDASDWAYMEVEEAASIGLIPEEMFYDELYRNINREEFAAIAVKLYEHIIGEAPIIDIGDIPFTDCDYESEYISYIATAYELGITKGTSQSTFSPYDNISREQLATMLYRVIKLAENDEINNFDVNNVRKFYDDSEISDYAKESVYFMAEYGIVKGVDGAHFAPFDTATKEQSILISVRCVNSLFEH